MQPNEDIITKHYDFLLYLIPQLEKIPRTQKYVLSDRIENLTLDIFEMFITAYYSSGENKKRALTQANLEIEKLRFCIRLCHDLKFISHEKYGIITGKLNETGKMVGGWIKSIK